MSHNNVRMNCSLPAQSWALSLALYLNGLTTSDVERVSGFDVEHVTERTRAVGEEPEGILSDIRLPPSIPVPATACFYTLHSISMQDYQLHYFSIPTPAKSSYTSTSKVIKRVAAR